MKSVAFILAAVSLAITTTPASAQTARARAAASMTTAPMTPSIAIQPYAMTPAWQPYAATVDESWARGRADVIRALGENDLNSSAAAINWEAARRAATDNWANQVRTKNRIRDEYVTREKAEHPTLSPGQQKEISRLHDPKRLSAAQLSAAGVIRWPSALQSAEFDEARSRLDELFAERARGFSASADEITREVDAVVIEMTKALEQSDSDIPVMARVAAKNFLAGLRLEAHLRPDAAGNGQVAAAVKR
jgi:hypothetical protein